MRSSLDRKSASGTEGASNEERPTEFEPFFEKNQHRLFAALCVTTGNRHEAEEITQDAFLRVLERWEKVSRMDEPSGYLFMTAMNLFRRRYRRTKLGSAIAPGPSHLDDVFGPIDDRDVVVRALRDLPPRQRAAVVLTTLLDFPTKEAASILRIQESTVRALTTQARAQMRLTIGEER